MSILHPSQKRTTTSLHPFQKQKVLDKHKMHYGLQSKLNNNDTIKQAIKHF